MILTLTHIKIVVLWVVQHLEELDDVGVVELLHDGDLPVDLLERVLGHLAVAAAGQLAVGQAAAWKKDRP